MENRCCITRVLLGIIILLNVVMMGGNLIYAIKIDINNRSVVDELKEGEQLIYGEWRASEYLGGGIYEYSGALGEARQVDQNDELAEDFTIYPGYIGVDDNFVYGDTHLLCSIIPKKWTYNFTLPFLDDKGRIEAEINQIKQDFVLLIEIQREGEDVRRLLNKSWMQDYIIVINSDEVITLGMFGSMKFERKRDK